MMMTIIMMMMCLRVNPAQSIGLFRRLVDFVRDHISFDAIAMCGESPKLSTDDGVYHEGEDTE